MAAESLTSNERVGGEQGQPKGITPALPRKATDSPSKRLRLYGTAPEYEVLNEIADEVDQIAAERAAFATIVGEIAALLPLSETVKATATGWTMLAWFKNALAERERLKAMLKDALFAWSSAGMLPKERADDMFAACEGRPVKEDTVYERAHMLEHQVERLRAALKKYGKHDGECHSRVYSPIKGTCNCGLAEALRPADETSAVPKGNK